MIVSTYFYSNFKPQNKYHNQLGHFQYYTKTTNSRQVNTKCKLILSYRQLADKREEKHHQFLYSKISNVILVLFSFIIFNIIYLKISYILLLCQFKHLMESYWYEYCDKKNISLCFCTLFYTYIFVSAPRLLRVIY